MPMQIKKQIDNDRATNHRNMINNDDELMKQNWSGKTKRAEVTIVVKRAELNSVKRRTGGVLTNH
jgi:hypothetical protein